MFAGLVLTSISTAMMRAALFQRKSRSGWLEELDGIREDALDEANGELGHVVGSADDIWTDLRDGGVYSDPHEISSLYATDETPDLPTAKTNQRAARASAAKDSSAKASSAKAVARRSRAKAPAAPEPEVSPVAAPAADLAPFAVSEPQSPAAAIDEVWPMAHESSPNTHYDSDQIWVQPAPHPIRPSEMWHPAELAPSPLIEQPSEHAEEARVASAELIDAGSADPAPAGHRPSETHHPVIPARELTHLDDVDHDMAAQLEHELVAAADVAVIVDPAPVAQGPDGPSASLTAGPVGRKVRRDRPADRRRTELPTGGEAAGEMRMFTRGDRSPLPTQPLPRAALPTRSNRLPTFDSLPATPSSAVPTGGHPSSGRLPVVPVPSPTADPMPIGVPDEPQAEPVAEAVAGPDALAAAPEPVIAADAAALQSPLEDGEAPTAIDAQAPVAIPVLEITPDGIVGVPGTIVRLGGARAAAATAEADTAAIRLLEGWCWVSPGDGQPTEVRIDMPNGSLVVEPGATALAVVEADWSAFVIIASGFAELRRPTDGGPLSRGAIVMIDPEGAAQLDQATDAEIESDPLVAENLALDAEL